MEATVFRLIDNVPEEVTGPPEIDNVVELAFTLVTVPVPDAVPLEALVILPFASTTMVERVYVPADTPVEDNVAEIEDAPLPVISPERVIFSLCCNGVKPKAVVMSEEAREAFPVTRPFTSTMTFAYVPAVTPVLVKSTVIVPEVVIGPPETDKALDPFAILTD